MSVDKDSTQHVDQVHATEGDQPVHLRSLLPTLGRPWYRVPWLLRLNLLLTVPMITSVMSGYDGSMLNGTQSLEPWQEDFNYPRGGRLAILTTMQTIGAVSALPFAPPLTDRLGRRHPVVIGSILALLGAGLQTAANDVPMFAAGRFFLGFGFGLVNNACAPLVAELAYPSHRPIVTALFNTSWYLGSIAAAWTTYGTFRIENSWSWRIPSALQAVTSLYQLFGAYLVPESPRWLVGQNRTSEARSILVKYHGGGDAASPLVDFELAEISVAIEMEKMQNKNSYLSFLTTKGNRWRLFIVFILGFMGQWAGNGLVSFYLVLILNNIGITNGETQNLINGILQIFNYITSILAALTVERVGRRPLLLTSFGGMGVAFLIWTVLSAVNEQRDFDSSTGIGVVVMIFVFYFFFNIGMNPVPIAYSLEILPFTLRAKGMMLGQVSSLGCAVFNGFANPIALDAIGWRYYIVFVVLIAVWGIIVYFCFPETKGLSLEEVAEIFDGPGRSGRVQDRLASEKVEVDV